MPLPLRLRSFGLSLLALGTSLSLSSCSKSDSDASSSLFINFGPGEGHDLRTGTNLPMGPTDPTDWTLDGKWNTTEQKLFQSLGLDLNGPVQNPGKISTAGYPNPAIGAFRFSYSSWQSPQAVRCKVVVVNQVYQPLIEATSPGLSPNQEFQFDISGSSFRRGQLYRVYYVMYHGTTLYHKGHGDIKIEENH
ncbi:hypothetical protein JAO73_06315 [Hymenobacter sp. BT523]|uniref:hypothetical protein n=1 Tax=Hymenobacter sp. BT523 TaxID=2795725 RepID=UPI0018EB9752|nr:hypothetical protein [Hymenobacter sp. BT523]MBJ6108612.1 hypothetical protein [Hymenobacter sp. BT523]